MPVFRTTGRSNRNAASAPWQSSPQKASEPFPRTPHSGHQSKRGSPAERMNSSTFVPTAGFESIEMRIGEQHGRCVPKKRMREGGTSRNLKRTEAKKIQ